MGELDFPVHAAGSHERGTNGLFEPDNRREGGVFMFSLKRYIEKILIKYSRYLSEEAELKTELMTIVFVTVFIAKIDLLKHELL